MAVIKCKMCGGDLEIKEGLTVAECEYCGSRQTIPTADNEKKLTLFGRAGRLLRGCEFDKAAGVFESIVADFPEEAEAYWGLVLCKYGIEYVDDPATGKKIPTCHRSSFDSVLDDENFEQACENADAVARRVYRDEARQIEELRQAILQVSGKEEPYDVFISYKETDEHGERTLDSVIAQDIYKELTNEGYRVFFSRISLEDKLGTEYEPYIFAALNSAKVMLVVGTDYENFDAVWVKNEWSRFLKLIAKGEKKTLIPVFKNMDAYDMPKEFLKLSAQDMGKVGAMQDLVRGVEKILGRKKAEPEQAQPVQQPVYVSGGPNVTAMIERGHQALEDGEWAKADEFFDQALNMDAKCAEAFLGKFLAQEKAVSLDAVLDNRLAECDRKAVTEAKRIQMDNARAGRVITENLIPGYSVRSLLEKEIHFDPSYPSTADYYANQAPKEKERLRADRLFTRAERYANGELADSVKRSVRRFEDALDQKVQTARDAAAKAKQEKETAYTAHMERAEAKLSEMRRDAEAKREQDYQEACKLRQEAETIPGYGQAIKKLTSTGLAEYKDCAKLADECRAAIAEIEEQQRKERAAKEEADRQRKEAEAKAAAEEAERQRIEREKAEAARKKENRTITTVVTVMAVVVIAALFIVTKIIIPGNQYQRASELEETGRLDEAQLAFEALENYKDSAERANHIATVIAENEAAELAAQREAENAAAYSAAEKLMSEGEYEKAASAFESLGKYRDSSKRAKEAIEAKNAEDYSMAMDYLNRKNFDDAIAAFEALGTYKDSAQQKENAMRLRQLSALRNASVGDVVTFGSYEQDNDKNNGKEDIEWIVLAQEKNRLLVISRYGLDVKRFAERSATWETSELREWLNNSFLQNAFDAYEQSMIPEVTVPAHKNPSYTQNPGNATQDKVFVLSAKEADEYFASKDERACHATPYAIDQGAYVLPKNENCQWWLRTPGNFDGRVCGVDYFGCISLIGSDTSDGLAGSGGVIARNAVRPSLWIEYEEAEG